MTRSRPRPAAARAAAVVALLALLAAGGLLAAGALPRTVGVALVGAGALTATTVTAGVVLRRAGRTAHPRAWRVYGTSLLIGCVATGAVQAVAGSTREAVLASLPGQVLGTTAILLMADRSALRAQRSVVLSSLALYVVATQLALHTALRMLAALPGIPPALDPQASLLLCSGIALVTGSALTVYSTRGAASRQRGATLLVGQACWSLVALSAQLTPRDLASPLQSVTLLASCGAVVAVLRAVRLDQAAAPGPAGPASGRRSAVAAMLPHVVALVGGTGLIVSVPVTGSLDLVSTALGVVGLGLLVVHQFVAWRAMSALGEDLRRSDARFRTLVRGSEDPVVVLDEQLRVSWVSSTIDDLLGLAPEDVVGQPLVSAAHPDDVAWLCEALTGAAGVPAAAEVVTVRLRHRDGRWRLIRARVRDLRADPDVAALVLYARDVTDTGSVPRETARPSAAVVDADTGLPNATALARRLQPEARVPGAAEGQGALLLVGVRGLPEAGSVVLLEVLGALTRVLRDGDWLARPAPDQFAVLVAGGDADALVVARRVLHALDRVRPSAGRTAVRSAAGVVRLEAGAGSGELLRRAETTLGVAQAATTDEERVAGWSTAARLQQDRRTVLRADLPAAVAGGALAVEYQPVVDLALHRAATVEALVRWTHPVLGPVSPDEFVPLAEEAHLVADLGRHVLRTATARVAELADSRVSVAVNVSTTHLVSGSLVADVAAALRGSGLPPTRLVVEITESVLLEDRHVAADLQALRDLGVRIAVDDFGTGWSSLAYLAGLPVDLLKMDKQFLAGLVGDPQRQALCRVVLHLGSSLGLPVVVEGVETEAELHLVHGMGHRFVQGYVFSCPVGPDDLPGVLAELDTAGRGVVVG
ncbi:putative bifunctional diguanylate cyclase/phosphodiesterase [Klenkia taihuensis]|uniref:PAS domain S-box-containing protein n=1 Tax=Klenkia taihuensis TaxID=1225127 RepID=A0A1I1HGW2_9ACTN|nr:GGDEF domain-containing phosphodiesterase [Klenkia taihuensis]SFC20350.1 PAS domain S-box-containing protein [Klenkia taihuensis]